MPEPKEPNARNRRPADEPDDAPVAIGDTGWTPDEDDEQEPAASRMTFDPIETPVPPGVEDLEAGDRAVDKPGAELAAGAACLALALSTFLPWYGAEPRTVSGFASGTWGPVIFFLGIAGALIVLLRRLKVPIAFPIEHGAVLEGIGWVSVFGLILKRFLRPKPGGFDLGLSEPYFFLFNGLMVALLCAVAVALLAGRLTTGSPFMVRPGWLAGFAGKLGVAILGAAILTGISFGFFNSDDAGVSTGPGVDIRTFEGKAPPCMREVPLPKGAKITVGKDLINQETKKRTACTVQFTIGTSVAKASERVESVLRREGILFRDPLTGAASMKGQRSIVITEPCGIISLSKMSRRKTNGQVLLTYEAICPYALTTAPPG